MGQQEQMSELSSFTAKLLLEKFGRKPNCEGFIAGKFLIFYIHDFLSTMEEVLLQQGFLDSIEISRNIVMNSLLSELKGIIEITLNERVDHFYHDWNYHNNTGMIAVTFQSWVTQVDDPYHSFKEKKLLEDEVNRLSQMVEKIPNVTEAFQINENCYVILRDGILVPIEKILILKGYQAELLLSKDELEKNQFRQQAQFEAIFNKQVKDIFIDWKLDKDKSLICLVLK